MPSESAVKIVTLRAAGLWACAMLVATRDEASEGGSSPYWLGGAGGPVGAAGTQTQE